MHILFFLAIVQFQGTLIKIQSNLHVRPPLVSDYLPLAIIQNTKMFSLKPFKVGSSRKQTPPRKRPRPFFRMTVLEFSIVLTSFKLPSDTIYYATQSIRRTLETKWIELQRYRDLKISPNTFSPKSRFVRTSPRKRPLASSILVRRAVRQYKRDFSPLLLHPFKSPAHYLYYH